MENARELSRKKVAGVDRVELKSLKVDGRATNSPNNKMLGDQLAAINLRMAAMQAKKPSEWWKIDANILSALCQTLNRQI